MIMHFVFVISAQLTATTCAIAVQPWNSSYQSDTVYLICILIWTVIRKLSEFSILLIVDIMYQNQLEAIKEDFFEENDKRQPRPSIESINDDLANSPLSRPSSKSEPRIKNGIETDL